MPTLYRVEPAVPKTHAAGSRRPPSNVPYVVDNLWEWARPANMPSRRGSAYASTSPELARDNASSQGADSLVALRFAPDAVVVQMQEKDAKHHPDCKPGNLRKTLFGLLNKMNPDWANQPVQVKMMAAPLFLPVLDQKELNALLGHGGPLATIAEDLREAITFWDSIKVVDLGDDRLPFPDGELFFSEEQAVIGRDAIR